MIKGIGIDLIEIDRIKKAMEKPGFLQKYFTEAEIKMFEEQGNKAAKVAGNFSTKEAVVKVFGTGFRQARLVDIEVLRDDMGKPLVHLTGGAAAVCAKLGIDYIHASISNTDTHVTAVAIGEKTVSPGIH